MSGLAFWVNSDLSNAFKGLLAAQNHDWPESVNTSQPLVNTDDFIIKKKN